MMNKKRSEMCCELGSTSSSIPSYFSPVICSLLELKGYYFITEIELFSYLFENGSQ